MHVEYTVMILSYRNDPKLLDRKVAQTSADSDQTASRGAV